MNAVPTLPLPSGREIPILKAKAYKHLCLGHDVVAGMMPQVQFAKRHRAYRDRDLFAIFPITRGVFFPPKRVRSLFLAWSTVNSFALVLTAKSSENASRIPSAKMVFDWVRSRKSKYRLCGAPSLFRNPKSLRIPINKRSFVEVNPRFSRNFTENLSGVEHLKSRRNMPELHSS